VVAAESGVVAGVVSGGRDRVVQEERRV